MLSSARARSVRLREIRPTIERRKPERLVSAGGNGRRCASVSPPSAVSVPTRSSQPIGSPLDGTIAHTVYNPYHVLYVGRLIGHASAPPWCWCAGRPVRLADRRARDPVQEEQER